MRAVFTSLGSASAFILLTLLLVSGADGDIVTSKHCRNRDKSMRVRQYPDDPDVTKIWLRSCNINEINKDDIIGVTNITDIFLGNNTIVQLDLAIFRHFPTLAYLDLENIQLRELPAFPDHSCPRLAVLHLNNNQLTTLNNAGTFAACTHLQKLKLLNNEIRYIHPDVFNSLTELEILHLSGNKLSFIPDQMLANNKKLRQLWLEKNRLTYLPQDFASSFKRAGVGLDTFYYYGNPWRCACLLELLADVKRAVVREYEDYHRYRGRQPECAYSGTVPCYRHPPSGLLPPPRVATGGGR